MPRKNSFKGKIKWQPIFCDERTTGLLPLLWTDQFPDSDFSDIALTSNEAAEYFGLSKLSVYNFLRKHRDKARVRFGIHFFPIPVLDKLIRKVLPKEPLINSSLIPDYLNLSRYGYQKLYHAGKIPVFRYGSRTWITYEDLQKLRMGRGAPPKRLKTFQ